MSADRLSPAEERDLVAQEAIIANARDSIESNYLDIGAALKIVRDRKLYREGGRTFETYCKEKWDYSRQHAYRLIAAYDTAIGLSPRGDKPPTEYAARPLVSLPTEVAQEVMEEAARENNGKAPTAAQIAAVANRKVQEAARAALDQLPPDKQAAIMNGARKVKAGRNEKPADADLAHKIARADRHLELAANAYRRMGKTLNDAIATLRTIWGEMVERVEKRDEEKAARKAQKKAKKKQRA